MKSKYVDIPSTVQVIGCIYNHPEILDNDEYTFIEEDFPEEIHKIIFGSIFNLHQLGVTQITLTEIEDYLTSRPKKLGVYKANKGPEYILKCAENAKQSSFNYYYGRIKKMSLLRAYEESLGMDLSWLYDVDNILDSKKKQEQEDWLDNTPIQDIVKLIDGKIDLIKAQYEADGGVDSCNLGDGIDELIASYAENPDFGYPLYGPYVNTITRGARLGKFYLRSAATNVGKTRTMVADACYMGCYQMYDVVTNRWISTGKAQPVLFIATEQDRSEIQASALAFLSGVNEEHILTNNYFSGETERVGKAAQLLKQSKITFENHPDFSLIEIENTIKKNIRERGVRYIYFDYIRTSMKILEEITRRSGGVRLREDNILFMLSLKLKAIAVQYQVFILSSTQLNADYQDSETPDQNLLRGAKSIADAIDGGMILLEVTQKDKEALATITNKLGCEMPNVKMSIYKNRGNRWKNIYCWMIADKGICQFKTLFVTDWVYQLQEMEDIKIKVEEENAF